ncbi:hypothetical protein HKBW3S06_00257 [Candidatus Hakubella thermalkaliphila]|uniref:HicB-like antitoxin of toxin-antitoxin system domain-containing protein n=2 Tax=Candidatus Hakubella thermalkaliphila TaxID=2754717 RepID=A0A6V8P4B5_9ACTN|nr:hypothetical protein HKBW3S06_00257 [Candidatus Hakubella thermalkaliphila]GFP27459.1 hypothetical protein HKBW3S33_00872 [Candidatus Hakubella thermalkaliphila]
MEGRGDMRRVIFRAEIFKEGEVYVGLCPELNISSFGEDIEDARRSLQEALGAFLEECEEMGTLEEVLEEAGFLQREGTWVSREPVVEEKMAISR